MEVADAAPVSGAQKQSTLDQFWKEPMNHAISVKDVVKVVQPVEIVVAGLSKHMESASKFKRKKDSEGFLREPLKGNVFPAIPLDVVSLPRKRQMIKKAVHATILREGLHYNGVVNKKRAKVGTEKYDGLSSSAKPQFRKRPRLPTTPASPDPFQKLSYTKTLNVDSEECSKNSLGKIIGKKQPRIRKDGKPDERFKCEISGLVTTPLDESPLLEDSGMPLVEEITSKRAGSNHPSGTRKDGKPDERFKIRKVSSASDFVRQDLGMKRCSLLQGRVKDNEAEMEIPILPQGRKILSAEVIKNGKASVRVKSEEKVAAGHVETYLTKRPEVTMSFPVPKNELTSVVRVRDPNSRKERRLSTGTRKDGRPDERFKRRDDATAAIGPSVKLLRGKRTKYKVLPSVLIEDHRRQEPVAESTISCNNSEEGVEGRNDLKMAALRGSHIKLQETKGREETGDKQRSLLDERGKRPLQVATKRRQKIKEQVVSEPLQSVNRQDARATIGSVHAKKLPEVQKNGVRNPKRVQLKRLFVDNPGPSQLAGGKNGTNSRVVKSLWSPPKQMKHIAEFGSNDSRFPSRPAKSTKFLSLQQLDVHKKNAKCSVTSVTPVVGNQEQTSTSDVTISDCCLPAPHNQTSPSSFVETHEDLRPHVKPKLHTNGSLSCDARVSMPEQESGKHTMSDPPIEMEKTEEQSQRIPEKANPGIRMTPRTRKLTDAMQNFLLQKATLLQQWKEMELGKIHPMALIGRSCKIFWPLDSEWYPGVIHEYNPQTRKHRIDYEDDEREWVLLGKERVKLYVSAEESKALELSFGEASLEQIKKLDADELAVLAAGMEDFGGELSHGDLVWAKVKGYPMWPAFVMDEEHANISGLEPAARERTVAVQFFGSYDHARISCKKVLQFSKGIMQKYHTKCKRTVFEQGLQEVERYLKECKLPESMAQLQEDVSDIVNKRIDEAVTPEGSEDDPDFLKHERSNVGDKSAQSSFSLPIKLGALHVLSLGKIVRDSEQFHNEHHIWTEGYTAIRKFTSSKDPQKMVDYRMEVLRNPSMRSLPLFRVIPEDGKQVEGPSASACWKKILINVQRAKEKAGSCEASLLEKKRQAFRSGPSMFGFGNRRVSKLIQALPYARVCSKFTSWIDKPLLEDGAEEPLPAGYRPVDLRWEHLDRCNVCYLDEEYADNQLLQCDKCRIMVHMYCYGEMEAPDGDLWLCNLCRPGAPKTAPFCCLCPVTGGAMKTTTDGRWAHITCAMWTPETCLVDVKRMEPVDGISAINKERWKLLCTVCKVPYGACIQCSKPHCHVSFHPLCARAAGLSMEVLEEKCANMADSDGGLQLLTYCKKHKQGGQGCTVKPQSQQPITVPRNCSSFCPPQNPSGCARGEPYNAASRRGRREPEAVAAALAKRYFVENMPYIVNGCRINVPDGELKSLGGSLWSRHWKPQNGSLTDGPLNEDEVDSGKMVSSTSERSQMVLSTSERFRHMRSTMHQRLTFGKSAIHGWGVFTKRAHSTGDMVIEYAGEIVRPMVADIRERRSYDSLVGAGTYMFRIDDERVVDATHTGSIAHLINHSCEPNCYSRVVAASGEDHIIIFAKRDILEGEELTYDYRFASKDELLTCYCGSVGCRGSVNTFGSDDEPSRIIAPRSELTKCFVS